MRNLYMKLEHNWIVIMLLLTFFLALMNADAEVNVKKCATGVCVNAANFYMDSVDTAIPPCTDFYRHSCGKWIKNSALNGEDADHFIHARNNFHSEVQGLLEDDGIKDIQHFKKSKLFYSACMDKHLRENISKFTKDINSFGGWPVLEKKWNDLDWLNILQEMILIGYDGGLFLSVDVIPDPFDSTLYVLKISKPNLELQPIGVNRKTKNGVISGLTRYADVLLALAETLSTKEKTFNKTAAVSDIQKSLEIEIQLLQMTQSFTTKNQHQILTLHELQSAAPDLDWSRFLKVHLNTTISPNEMIVVPSLDIIKNITFYIKELNGTYEGRRAIANYIMYRTVFLSSKNLNQEMQKLYNDYKNIYVPVDEHCASTTIANLAVSIVATYQKFYSNESNRKKLMDLVDKLKKEFLDMLASTWWIDDETKSEAAKKFQALSVILWFPDNVRNDTLVNEMYHELDVGKDHFVNVLQANLFSSMISMLNHVRKGSEYTFVYISSAITGTKVTYFPGINQILIPLSISGKFFFDEKNPGYINYGRLGSLIAHEISHVIDERGTGYDIEGNYEDWWKNKTLLKYEMKTKCIIDLFRDFIRNTTSFNVNGERLLNELVADSAGNRASYSVYTKYGHQMDQQLPGLKYTAKQLYWLSYATMWCQRITTEERDSEILNEEREPNIFKVNGMTGDNEYFSIDFDCDVGTAMNPSCNKCKVFGK